MFFGNKAVFFDRDGVLNFLTNTDSARGPRDLAELRIDLRYSEVLKSLVANDFLVFVVSNQPDLARGLLSLDNHRAITNSLQSEFPEIRGFYYCSHDNSNACDCRKPKPGLLLSAISEYEIDKSRSFFIGDKWTDVVAGKLAGVKTVLVENGGSWIGTSQGDPPPGLEPDYLIRDPKELFLILGLV